MATPGSSATVEPQFPPIPQDGPAEESALALQNFSERERASRSWLSRLRLTNKSHVVPLQRRHVKLVAKTEDEERNEDADISGRAGSAVQLGPRTGESVDISTARLPVAHDRRQSSQDSGRIFLRDSYTIDPRKDEQLYQWAVVYENQRG